MRPRTRVLALLLLLALEASAPAAALAAAGPRGRLVVEARVAPDGWALAVLHPPPGVRYRLVAVEGDAAGPGWRGAAARPLLYATLPDPGLWERLARLPVAVAPSAAEPSPVAVEAPGVEVFAVPGRPGGVVRLVLEAEQRGPAAGEEGRPLMVIVVPHGDAIARAYAEKIAGLHRGSMRVLILDTREVARRYPEAPEPPGACRPGAEGAPRYNLSLALHIIGMERALLREGLRYLLLIGGAREVPPVYYCSPLLSELVSRREGLVPSDYYYADPDYDGKAEVAVGRIPFTDALGLAAYYDALRAWLRGGPWQRLGLVTGGAPFTSTLFVGEEAAGEAAAAMRAMNISVDMFMLGLGNYGNLQLAGYLGRYGIYYIMAHGSGDSLLDIVPGGLWNYDVEELLRSSQVAATDKPGIYILPACRDGYWDTDLVKPPFEPPSLGVALLEKGAAVAYAGFSRVAVEVIDGVSLARGRLSLSMAGADRLLLLYLRGLGEQPTIGEAWRQALTAYLALPSSHYRAYLATGEEDIGVLVTRTAVLLGDPAAPSPWRLNETLKPRPAPLEAPGAVELGAAYLAQTLARYATGTLPALNPGASGVLLLTLRGPCPGDLHAWALRRVLGTTLVDMTPLNASAAPVEGGEACRVTVYVPPSAPSLVMLTGLEDGAPYIYYVVAAGAYLDEKRGAIVLRGLDALGVVGDEPLLLELDNVTVATLQGGGTTAVIPLAALAGRARGNATLRLVPLYASASIYGGHLVAEQARRLLRLFQLNVTLPAAPSPPAATYGPASPPAPGGHGAGGRAEAGTAGGEELGRLLEEARLAAAVAVLGAAAGVAAVYAARRHRGGGPWWG